MTGKYIKLLTGFAALAGAAVSSAAHAEVVTESDGFFVTRDVAAVAATPREAWVALIAPARWWNSAHTWSADAANLSLMPKAGGCFCERIPAPKGEVSAPLEGSAQHMTVILAMPDQVLRMRGALGPLQSEAIDGVLTVTLKPIDGGTQILWEYVVGGHFRYETPMITKAVDGVMSEQLRGLAKYLGPLAKPDAPTVEPQAETDIDVAPEPARTTVDEAFGDLGEDTSPDSADTDTDAGAEAGPIEPEPLSEDAAKIIGDTSGATGR